MISDIIAALSKADMDVTLAVPELIVISQFQTG